MAKDKTAKDVPTASQTRKQAPEPKATPQESSPSKTQSFKLNVRGLGSGSASTQCLKISFVLLSILIVLISIAAIAVSIASAVTTKVYTSDQSGRVVGQVVLTVTAAITLTIIIYAITGMILKKRKPVHAATIVLVILAIIQAIILGVCVKVLARDEEQISMSILNSFRKSREGDQKQLKRWDTTQATFQCCGVFSAQDYRNPNLPPYFPPNIPVSCCPGYDINRPSSTQERELQLCKAKKEFYEEGCNPSILGAVVGIARVVMIVVIILIILEIVLAIIGGVLTKKDRENPDY